MKVETIEQMQKRHKSEIEVLQENCSHENVSDWTSYTSVGGLRLRSVKKCKSCNSKVNERFMNISTDVTDGINETPYSLINKEI